MATFRVGHVEPMILALMLLSTAQGLIEAPECNRFHFEEKLLEKMVVLDHTMKVTRSELETKLTKYESENSKLKDELVLVRAELETIKTETSNEALAEKLDNLRGNNNYVTEAQSERQQTLLHGTGGEEMMTYITQEVFRRLILTYDWSGGSDTQEPVAFIACLSGGDVNPTVGHPIIFNQEIQNYAHAYNTSDGMFTPPSAGVYHFSVQICINQNDLVAIQIVSASRIFAASTFQEKDGANTCYSVSTVAVLEKGEKVGVKCVRNINNSRGDPIEGDNPYTYMTMFNGVLIHPIA